MERGKAVKVEVEGDGGEEEWKAAKLFMAKGPSATLQFLKEEPKALLSALDAQAVEGPLSHEQSFVDPVLIRKQEAWKSLGSMSKPHAKRKFVELLSTLLPEWKTWHASYAHSTHVDVASHILSEFSRKTGLTLRSSL